MKQSPKLIVLLHFSVSKCSLLLVSVSEKSVLRANIDCAGVGNPSQNWVKSISNCKYSYTLIAVTEIYVS